MHSTFVYVVLLVGLASVFAAPLPKEEPPPITPEHIKTSQNNLKQMGSAFHAFHDAHNVMPNDITDRNGKALLSWRVELLPYIEEDKLYKQFIRDEPWDSANNKKLIEKMPKLYAPIRVKAKPGETFYQVFAGNEAPFGPMKRPRLAGFLDGTSRTGLVFEAGEPVLWTKPQDLPFNAKKALPKLGGLFDGDFHAVCCNGSVIRIRKNADPVLVKLFIMPADGYVLDLDQLTNPRSEAPRP